jgi:lysophospholipase L1-like esterase
MKRSIFCVLLVFMSSFNVMNAQNKVIKIACVGNSITYGAGMANREKNAYPAQLQNLLGDNYNVQNFGVNGCTLLKKGDAPYWETEAYENALAFTPDIVYIKLGTNDSKLQNRVYLEEFESDYNDLISNFKEKNKDIRIVLLLPVPSFLKDTTSIWNPVIKDQIIPKTQKTAYSNNVEVIDLYQLFIDKSGLFPDKIHPSSLGATVIAKRIYENIFLEESEKLKIRNSKKIAINNVSNFYGFDQTDFKMDQISCKIVRPKKVAKGSPWVLRARFWGHEPQTDIALLERGFHIAYCDVGSLFGGEEAVNRWNQFYVYATALGLSKKVVLEGMSRGGLIIYNWAVENPEKIACVYADAPVLDGTSWPGGFGNGKGSPSDWEKFKKIYKISSDKEIDRFKGNPIHKVKEIVTAGFPMMHVCGEVDKVVPIDENTRKFENEIKAFGGEISVVYKKDVGHHPHSMKNPTSIVDFVLRVTGYKTNFAVLPSPGSEYRAGAGWKEGKGWWYQMEDIDSLSRNSGKLDLLLIGNSITQGFGGSRTLTTYRPGQKAANIFFKELNWMNAGISGDRTQHVAWRVQNGNYEIGKPTFITLAVGVNNFGANTAEEIAEGIIVSLNEIRTKIPHAKILFYGPLPAGIEKNSSKRIKYDNIHALIADLGKLKSVYYYNVLSDFEDEKGDLKDNYYSGDGIHLKPEGYIIWANHIKTQMKELR